MRGSQYWLPVTKLGYGQYHLAVAGGCAAERFHVTTLDPPVYREVVLTLSKLGLRNSTNLHPD
jgi:hypothetical protein